MTVETAQKTAVVVWWIALVLTFALPMTTTLPPELGQYLDHRARRSSAELEMWVAAAGLGGNVVALAASILLYRLKRWAAWPFALGSVVALAASALVAPTVAHPLTMLFDYTRTFAAGFLIACAWLSGPILSSGARSRRRPADQRRRRRPPERG